MFDVSFGELVLIGIVALLVIGPERLPKVARTAGLWAGRARHFVASVKADIEQELKAEELKRIMAEQAKSSGVHEIIEETKESLKEVKESLQEAKENLEVEPLVKSQPTIAPSSSETEQPPSPGAEHEHKA